jgi:hypothetical protein
MGVRMLKKTIITGRGSEKALLSLFQPDVRVNFMYVKVQFSGNTSPVTL